MDMWHDPLPDLSSSFHKHILHCHIFDEPMDPRLRLTRVWVLPNTPQWGKAERAWAGFEPRTPGLQGMSSTIWPKEYPLCQVARAHDQLDYSGRTSNCHIKCYYKARFASYRTLRIISTHTQLTSTKLTQEF